MIVQCWLEAGGTAKSLRYVAFHHIVNDDVVDAINREMNRQQAEPGTNTIITPADAAWNENLFARCSSSVARALTVLDPARPACSPKAYLVCPDPERDWMHMIVDLNRNWEEDPPVAADETAIALGNERPARRLGSGLLDLSRRISKPSGNTMGKPMSKPMEKPVGKPVGKPGGKHAGKPLGKPVGKPTRRLGTTTATRSPMDVRSSLQRTVKSTSRTPMTVNIKGNIQISGKFVDAASSCNLNFHFQISK